MLPEQARQVLMLRTGIDERHPFSGRQVARRLHINPGREARVEHTAVVDLRRSASAGACAGGRIVMVQVPPQNRLVAVSPALAGTGTAVPVSVTTPGQSSGGTQEHGTVSAASAQRGGGSAPPATPSAIESAVIAQLPDSNPSAAVVVLLGFALLCGLALLSAAGRRVALRRGLEIAPAGGVTQASGSSAAGAAGSSASTAQQWLPPAFVPGEPAPTPTPVAPVAPTAEDVGAPASEPVLTPEPAGPEPEISGPASATPAPPVPAAAPAAPPQPNPDWLRTHRSQIALALTAAAGGALHLLARGRRRR